MLTLLRQKIIYKFCNIISFDEYLPKYEDHNDQLKKNMSMNSFKII